MFMRHLKAVLRVGLRKYLDEIWYLREFRGGTLIGQDSLGNKYFEMTTEQAPSVPFYRKRYVELAEGTAEASMVPAEWHGWLHYTNDDAPSRSPEKYTHQPWYQPHTPNWTGTANRYVPYSTTIRKIGVYKPENLDTTRVAFFGNATLSDQAKGRINAEPEIEKRIIA